MTDPKSKTEQLRALKIGKGVQYLLNEAYKILGNPILAHDMEYKIIAHTENIVTDDPIWNEYAATGTVSFDRLVFFKEENFLDDAANTKKVTLLKSNELKYDRIYGKIFNGEHIQVGCACITETHKPFDADDPIIFGVLCDILDKELARSDYFRRYGQEYQESLINKLIDGALEDKGIYTAHVESIYINLKDRLYLAVADISQCDLANNGLSYFRDLFKRTQPAFKYSIYHDYIAIIMSSDSETADVKKDFDKLNKLLIKNNINVGISGCFDNLFELPKYYMEAVDALGHGARYDNGQWIFV